MKFKKFIAEFPSEKKQYSEDLKKIQIPCAKKLFPCPSFNANVPTFFGLFFNKFNQRADPLLSSRLLRKSLNIKIQ